jgi:hypothetical protein
MTDGATELKKSTGKPELDEAVIGVLADLVGTPAEALQHYPYPGKSNALIRDYFKSDKLTRIERVTRQLIHEMIQNQYRDAVLLSPDSASIALQPLATHYAKYPKGDGNSLSLRYMMDIAEHYPAVIADGLAKKLSIPEAVIERAGIVHVKTGFPKVDEAVQKALEALKESPLEALKTYPAWEGSDASLKAYFAPEGVLNLALATDEQGKATQQNIKAKLQDAYIAAMKRTPENATTALIAVANYCEKNHIVLNEGSFELSLMHEIATCQPKAVSDAKESKLCTIPTVVVERAITKLREFFSKEAAKKLASSGGHPAVPKVTDATHEGKAAPSPGFIQL